MQRASAIRNVVIVLVGTAAAWTVGCSGPAGPQTSQVQGKVSLDGTAVAVGTVSFVPDASTNGPSAGGLIANGAYQINEQGPMPGRYRVMILATRPTGKKIPAGTPAPAGTMIDEVQQYIPKRYNANTDLTVDIKPGRNKFDFDLKSK